MHDGCASAFADARLLAVSIDSLPFLAFLLHHRVNHFAIRRKFFESLASILHRYTLLLRISVVLLQSGAAFLQLSAIVLRPCGDGKALRLPGRALTVTGRSELL